MLRVMYRFNLNIVLGAISVVRFPWGEMPSNRSAAASTRRRISRRRNPPLDDGMADYALLIRLRATGYSRVCWDSSRVYHGCGQMDHGSEALVGLVCAHGDPFEFLQFAEEVLD